jgi:hypothetical protein
VTDAISDLQPERWLPVVGFEPYYEVSDLGRVRSFRRQTASGLRGGVVLRPSYSNTGGYPLVILTVNGKRFGRYVHQLVLEAHDRLPLPGEECRHYDENDPRNVRLDNLKWGTSGENKRDEVRHGTHYEASKDACDNGHEYTEASTRITYHADGSIKRRACRICANDRTKAWEARNRAAGKPCAAEEGCDKIARAKGLCSMHYARQHKADKAA